MLHIITTVSSAKYQTSYVINEKLSSYRAKSELAVSFPGAFQPINGLDLKSPEDAYKLFAVAAWLERWHVM